MAKKKRLPEELNELQRVLDHSGVSAPRGPQPIAEVLSRLMTRRGYANIQTDHDWSDVWHRLSGKQSAHSRAGKFNRGILEVTVRNSAVLQELTFRKKPLLAAIQQERPECKVKDLRFRVGPLD